MGPGVRRDGSAEWSAIEDRCERSAQPVMRCAGDARAKAMATRPPYAFAAFDASASATAVRMSATENGLVMTS